MLIYEGTKSEFMLEMEEERLPSRIEALVYEKMRRRTTKNEYNAWENSLRYMYMVLNDSHIPSDSGVAIEYNIPQTAKRIDFIRLCQVLVGKFFIFLAVRILQYFFV
jgi:hypothetical protein